VAKPMMISEAKLPQDFPATELIQKILALSSRTWQNSKSCLLDCVATMAVICWSAACSNSKIGWLSIPSGNRLGLLESLATTAHLCPICSNMQKCKSPLQPSPEPHDCGQAGFRQPGGFRLFLHSCQLSRSVLAAFPISFLPIKFVRTNPSGMRTIELHSIFRSAEFMFLHLRSRS